MKNIDFTEGNITKKLIQFFIPILFGTFFQQLYNTVDTIIVGKALGTNALAAVGATTNLSSFIIYFYVGLASGATVITSQFFGAKDDESISKTVHTSLILAIVCGLVMTMTGFLFSRRFLLWINVPDKLIDLSVLYIKWYFIGMVPSCIYNVYAGILRALGDSKTPVYFLLLCSLLNMIFDVLLIIVYKQGVAGAAFATVIAQSTCCLFIVFHFKRLKLFFFHKISIDFKILKEILRIGIPAAFQSCMWSIANFFIQVQVNVFGTYAIAALTAYEKVEDIFWMISGAIGQAVTTSAAQNYGAHKYKRINKGRKDGLKIYISVSLIFLVIMLLMGRQIAYIFTDDIHVVEYYMKVLYAVIAFYAFYGFVECNGGMMRGCGDSFKPLVLSFFGTCILRIVFVTFIAPVFGTFEAVMFSYSITWIVSGLLFMYAGRRFIKDLELNI